MTADETDRAAMERIIDKYGPALRALADESRYGCACGSCQGKREEREILEDYWIVEP